MGLTQGTELMEKILGTYRKLRDLEALRLEQPWWLPYSLFLRLAEGKTEKPFVAALQQAKPAMLARLRGIAEALATCATVTEAIDRLTAGPRWGAAVLMLADASGDLASVELSNTRAGVRRPDPGTDWLLITNVCLCPETCVVQVSASAVYSEKAPTPTRGGSVLQPHVTRARRIEELVLKQSNLGPDELAAIMADHGPTGVPDGASPCVHSGYFNTTASLQWYPARRSARVFHGPACRANYVEIGL